MENPVATADEHQSASCARLCPMIDAPVCGSDGMSYANVCYFEEAQCNNPGLAVVLKALCPEDRAFNLEYNPLAGAAAGGSDSSSSTSACDAIMCADVDDPVCTTDGTMKNSCFFKKEQCKTPHVELLSSRGPCEPIAIMPRCPATCTQEYVPVCASNGMIYGNECLFRQAKCARPFASSFVARDLSDCELNVGDSTSTVQGIRTVITSVFD